MRNRVLGWSAALAVLLLGVAAAGSADLMAAQEGARDRVQKVDVNKATAEELIALPGIGPALADRIIEFRERNGPFERIEELLKVQGIGEKSLERLRDLIVVGKARKK